MLKRGAKQLSLKIALFLLIPPMEQKAALNLSSPATSKAALALRAFLRLQPPNVRLSVLKLRQNLKDLSVLPSLSRLLLDFL